MKRFLLLFLSVTLTAATAGCAASRDPKDVNTAQLRQNKKTTDLYGPLVGTYEGELTNTDHGNEQVEVVIYLTTEAAPNPDGTTGSREVPRAYFKRLAPVVADYSLLAAGYTPEDGTLSLINDQNSAGIKSIDAHVAGRLITGQVETFQGTLGDLNVHFVSSDTSSNDDFKDRLLKAYQAVAGEYDGSIISPDKKTKDIPVVISLSAIVNGDTPQLIGFYRRPDAPDGAIDLPLTVSYRPDQYPAQITMNGKGGGKYQIDIDGTLANGTIQAAFNTLYQGYLGTLVVKKVRDQP